MEGGIVQFPQAYRINAEQIRTFVTVARLGSISAASEELSYTQPTVSKIISRLEYQLDCKLFVRGGRGVTVTEPAAVLLKEWGPLLAGFEHSLEAFAHVACDAGALNVACHTPLVNDRNISRHLDEFIAGHPGMRLHFEAYGLRHIKQFLLDGKIDLAFTYSFDLEGEPDIECLLVEKVSTYLVGQKPVFEDPAAKGYRNLLVFSPSVSPLDSGKAMECCRKVGYEFQRVSYCPNQPSLELGVLRGEGAAVCGSYMLKKSPSLLAFPIPKEYVSNYICVAYRKGNRKKDLALFLSSVRDAIASLPG